MNSEPLDPLTGSNFLGYVVKGQIGAGGMGVVYEGEQPMIGKRVALKVLRAEMASDPELVKRLVSEARAVNAVGHRGIVDVFAYGQMPDGRHCIVMEYLDGDALDVVVDAHQASGTTLPLPDALLLLQETLRALAAAHSAGVIHRDLKPSNIFLCRQRDGSRFVKLLDFGIAKLGVNSMDVNSSRASMMVGTPSYMAPEQAAGGQVGAALDLYAVGVIAFELLTGRLPFLTNTVMETLLAHAQTPPPQLSELNPQIPPALNQLVLRMLAKRPEDRPRSADEVADQIENIRDQVLASPQWAGGAKRSGFSQALDAIVIARRISGTDHAAVSLSTPASRASTLEDTHASSPSLKPVKVTASGPLSVPPSAAAPAALESTRISAPVLPVVPERPRDADISMVTPPKSKGPIIGLAVLGVAALGGLWFAFSGGPTPAPGSTTPPPTATTTPPPAAVEKPVPPTPTVAPIPTPVAPVEPAAQTPVPSVATPEPSSAHPAGPAHQKPAVPEKVAEKVTPRPPEPTTPVPAPEPAAAKGSAFKTVIESRLKALEARIAAAEGRGVDVSFERKTIAVIRSKSGGPLAGDARDRLEAAVQRLEDSSNF